MEKTAKITKYNHRITGEEGDFKRSPSLNPLDGKPDMSQQCALASQKAVYPRLHQKMCRQQTEGGDPAENDLGILMDGNHKIIGIARDLKKSSSTVILNLY